MGGDGIHCRDSNECAAQKTNNCHINAKCINTDGGFTCTCSGGYMGDGINCQDIDECIQGADNCNENAECTNTDGGFTCTCKSGYEGDGITSCTSAGSTVITAAG